MSNEYKIQTGEIVYVVPFYWGYFISISDLLNQGYRRIQKLLVKKLNDLTGDNSWFVEDDIEQSDKNLDDDDRIWAMQENRVYGGATKLGTSFVSRLISPSERIDIGNFEFIIKELVFFYHEVGSATCRITVEIQFPQPVDMEFLHEITRDVKMTRPLLDFINHFISIDGKVLRNILDGNQIPVSINLQHFEGLIQSETIQISLFKGLWEHVIYKFEIPKQEAITDEDIKPFLPLINSSQRSGATDSTLDPCIRAYPGFGTSVIIYAKGKDPDSTNLVRVCEIAEYYYASTSMLDDLLFDKFTQFSGNRKEIQKIPKIQSDIEEISHLSNLLDIFMLTLKDSMINFNPTSKLVWKTYEKEWYYNPMIESLQEKSALLTEKYTERLNELNEKRNETLNRLVKIFTFFAVIGPLLEVYATLDEINFIDRVMELDSTTLLIIGVVILLVFGGIGTYIIKRMRQFY